MEPCGNQAGDMGNIHQQIRADRLGDLLESWKIKGARIGTGAYDKHPGLTFLRQLLHRIIVDSFGLTVHAIRKYTEQDPCTIYLAAVGEVTTLCEVHTQN